MTYAHWINQELVRHARHHIYMHPDNLLSNNIRLPQPDRRNFDANTGGALISEDGLFHGLSEDQLNGPSEAMPPRRDEDGMTINDLKWPIPGGVTSGRPTSW